MLDADDLDSFFDDDEFSIRVQIGMTANIQVIFDNTYVQDEFTETSQPTMLLRSDDVDDWEQGTEVWKDSTRYRITSIKPDGTGLSRIFLERQ